MTELEKKLRGKELLRTKSQDEVYGDFKDVEDGIYNVIITKLYRSFNANDKEFIGIRSTIQDGEYAGDFFTDCIYLNDEAWERGIQRIRNLLFFLGEEDVKDNELTSEFLLERLSVLAGKAAEVSVCSEDGMKTYGYTFK